MHTIRAGLARYCRKHPIALFFSIASTLLLWVLCILSVLRADSSASPLQLAVPIIWTLAIFRISWRLGQDARTTPTECSPVSAIQPSQTDALSMRVLGLRQGDNYNLFHLPDFRVPVLSLSVIFTNNTGKPIDTDDTFSLEGMIDGTWRTIQPTGPLPEPQPLTLPCGLSKKYAFPIEGAYDGLYPGDYRLVKSVLCDKTAITLTATFTID